MDALDRLNIPGGGEGQPEPTSATGTEPTPAPPAAEPNSPRDNRTRQRAQKMNEGFRAHRERQKRERAEGRTPNAKTDQMQKRGQDNRAARGQSRPPAAEQPAQSPDPKAAAQERRRKRTNRRLNQNAHSRVAEDERGNLGREFDPPMSFSVSEEMRNQGVPSKISNDEVQEFGWGAKQFAAREAAIEDEMAKMPGKMAGFKKAAEERARAAVLAELEAIAAESKAEVAAPAEPTAEQAQRFAKIVEERIDPPASLGRLSPAERTRIEKLARNRESTVDDLMSIYRSIAVAAGEDPDEAERTMRAAVKDGQAAKYWRALRQNLRSLDSLTDAPADEPAARAAAREVQAEQEPSGKTRRRNPLFAWALGLPDEEGEDLDPADLLEVVGLDPADLPKYLSPAERARIEKLSRSRDDKVREIGKTYLLMAIQAAAARKHRAGGDPTQQDGVDVLEPESVLSPSAKSAMRRKFSARAEARANARTVDEDGNAVEGAAPQFAPEPIDEIPPEEWRGARPGNPADDAESLKRYRDRAVEALEKSRAGRERLREDIIDNDAFLENFPMHHEGRKLQPHEIRRMAEKVEQDHLAAERDLGARVPREGDDGSVARSAIRLAAEAPTDPSADAFGPLYEAIRRHAPLVVDGGQEFKTEDVIELAEAIRRGEPGVSLADLPETFGIRDAVAAVARRERRAQTAARAERESAVEVEATVFPVAPKAPEGRPDEEAAEGSAAEPAEDEPATADAGGAGNPPPPEEPTASSGPADEEPGSGSGAEDSPSGEPAREDEPIEAEVVGDRPSPGERRRRAEAPTIEAEVVGERRETSASRRSTGEKLVRMLPGGGLLYGEKISTWFRRKWEGLLGEPRYNGRENPFKKERGPLFPFIWLWGWMWNTTKDILEKMNKKNK